MLGGIVLVSKGKSVQFNGTKEQETKLLEAISELKDQKAR